MENQLFMIKDNISGVFDLPIISSNLGSVRRTLKALIGAGNRFILDNIQDKDLYAVATIDTSSGVVVPTQAPTFVYHLTEVQDEYFRDIAAYQARLKAAGVEVKEGEADDEKEISKEA